MKKVIIGTSLLSVFLMMVVLLNSCNTKHIWSTGIVITKDDKAQTVTVQEDEELHKITIANKAVYDRIDLRQMLYITYEYNVNSLSKRNIRLNPSCKEY